MDGMRDPRAVLNAFNPVRCSRAASLARPQPKPAQAPILNRKFIDLFSSSLIYFSLINRHDVQIICIVMCGVLCCYW